MIRAALILMLLAGPAAALEERPGWTVIATEIPFDELVERVREAVEAAPINVVTQASASDGARMAGVEIPGNRVIGVFRNDYARRMLDASVAAGIEAPVRLYVTEEPGGAVLSWVRPSAVFAPYMDEGGEALADLAAELDGVLDAIGEAATGP